MPGLPGTGLIVHEWVERSGGAERVLEAMIEAFPDAAVRVLWNDAPDRLGVETAESWLARTPLRRHKALALPAMVPTWRISPARGDWVLVSSHLFAHHVRVPGDTPKYVYAHTPARYIWEPDRDRRGGGRAVRAASAVLRPLDRRRAGEASSIAVNSRFTGERVQRAWGRTSRVIHPPVDTETLLAVDDFTVGLTGAERRILDALPAAYLLGASRFVPYKRLERVIEIGAATRHPVVMAGGGPEEAALRARAGDLGAEVAFVIGPSDALLRALYARAAAFVFPATEDFGIMPVEAMACGTPVIAAREGGVPESVAAVGGGVVCDIDAASGWDDVLARATALDPAAFRPRTAMFSRQRFIDELRAWVSPSA